MKHEWVTTSIAVRSLFQEKFRSCKLGYALQNQVTNYAWMRVTGYRRYPTVGRCRPRTDKEQKEMLSNLSISEELYQKTVSKILKGR